MGCAQVEPGPSLGELLAMSNDKALSGKSVRLTTGPRKQQVRPPNPDPPFPGSLTSTVLVAAACYLLLSSRRMLLAIYLPSSRRMLLAAACCLLLVVRPPESETGRASHHARWGVQAEDVCRSHTRNPKPCTLNGQRYTLPPHTPPTPPPSNPPE